MSSSAMYGCGIVLVLCLIGSSVAQDEFEDTGPNQPFVADERDPLRVDQPVFDHPQNEVSKTEPQDANSACSCHGRFCTCCGWIYVSSVSYYQYTCVKIRYYRCTKTFTTSLRVAYRSYYTGQIRLYHPLTRCAKVYMYYVRQWVSFCVQLTNLKHSYYTVSGRTLLSVWWHGRRIGYYCLGYFTVSNTAEKNRLADDHYPDMIEAADDNVPAAVEARQNFPPPGFRDNAVAMEMVEEPETPDDGSDAIEERQDVPPPGFLGNPVAMEIVAEPLDDNQMM